MEEPTSDTPRSKGGRKTLKDKKKSLPKESKQKEKESSKQSDKESKLEKSSKAKPKKSDRLAAKSRESAHQSGAGSTLDLHDGGIDGEKKQQTNIAVTVTPDPTAKLNPESLPVAPSSSVIPHTASKVDSTKDKFGLKRSRSTAKKQKKALRKINGPDVEEQEAVTETLEGNTYKKEFNFFYKYF
jgi:hypothetical protein